jgi:Leucine-rich repeat (LRR) protein
MTIAELHTKLKEAYANQNLNKITVTLINLYKEQQFGTLRQIAEMISESVEFTIDPGTKYFSKLMMLYHPDRGDFHRNEIEKLAAKNDYDGLLGYAHILLLGRIEEIASTLSSFEDIDYSPVYEWDVNADGFNIVADSDPIRPEKQQQFKKRRYYNFYDAVKIRMYGNTKMEFPSHYLEDFDEFELAQSDINDLDGIQYCVHASSMDLSGNAINDISLLWGLTLLEELNLADNQLEDIDSLANLRNLKTVNLSNNGIKDISPLLKLSKLEFVDLSGLKIPHGQLSELEELGITVVI